MPGSAGDSWCVARGMGAESVRFSCLQKSLSCGESRKSHAVAWLFDGAGGVALIVALIEVLVAHDEEKDEFDEGDDGGDGGPAK